MLEQELPPLTRGKIGIVLAEEPGHVILLKDPMQTLLEELAADVRPGNFVRLAIKSEASAHDAVTAVGSEVP